MLWKIARVGQNTSLGALPGAGLWWELGQGAQGIQSSGSERVQDNTEEEGDVRRGWSWTGEIRPEGPDGGCVQMAQAGFGFGRSGGGHTLHLLPRGRWALGSFTDPHVCPMRSGANAEGQVANPCAGACLIHPGCTATHLRGLVVYKGDP